MALEDDLEKMNKYDNDNETQNTKRIFAYTLPSHEPLSASCFTCYI